MTNLQKGTASEYIRRKISNHIKFFKKSEMFCFVVFNVFLFTLLLKQETFYRTLDFGEL